MALDTTSRGTADALRLRPTRQRQRLRATGKLLRWSLVAVLVAALVGGTAWWFLGRGDSSEATDAVAGAQLLEVTSGTFGETVSAEGTVEAAETEELAFTSSGTVTAVNVAAGDTVTAGQVLATIDSAELEVRAAAAQADLADAEAELDTAEQSGSSDEQLDLAEASVATAQDAVESAFEALAGATLSASIDGLVTSVDLTVGEDLGASGTGGTTVTGSGTGSGLTSSQLGTRSNSTNYRVTIGLLQPDTELASGTTAASRSSRRPCEMLWRCRPRRCTSTKPVRL
ncbi:MAG: biotin/lipoyl-binding protein [Microthrixaceae bacterium]